MILDWIFPTVGRVGCRSSFRNSTRCSASPGVSRTDSTEVRPNCESMVWLPGEALMDMDTSGLENGNFRKSSAGMGGIHERGIEYLQPLARFQLLNYLPYVVEELLFSWTCANFESFSSKWWTIWVQIVNLPGRSWPRWPSHSQSFGPQDNPSISPWNGASKLSEQRWQMDFFLFWIYISNGGIYLQTEAASAGPRR